MIKKVNLMLYVFYYIKNRGKETNMVNAIQGNKTMTFFGYLA